jgi:hypothetical protein
MPPQPYQLQMLMDITDINIKMNTVNRNLDALVTEAEHMNQSLASGFNNVGTSAGDMAKGVAVGTLAVQALNMALAQLGAGASKFYDLVVASTALAARVETLGVAVQVVGQNMGYTSGQVNTFEKSIMDMNITTQAARQGLLFMGEALIDFSNGSKLARIAQDAAIIGNINSSEAFQRLVNAIQRGEPRMLRTIGISLSFERAYVREAAAMGKTERQLTDYEKSQIRVNEVVKVGARLAGTYEAAYDTVGKKMTSLPRVMEQIQLALGNVFLKGWQAVFTEVFDGLERLQRILEDTANAPALKNLQEAFKVLGTEAVAGIKELVNQFGKLFGMDAGSFSKTIDVITKQILMLTMLPDVYAQWKIEQDKFHADLAKSREGSLMFMPLDQLIGKGITAVYGEENVKKILDKTMGEGTAFKWGISQGNKVVSGIVEGLTGTASVTPTQKGFLEFWNDFTKTTPSSVDDMLAQATGVSPAQRRINDTLDLMNKQSTVTKNLRATDAANEAEYNDAIEGIDSKFNQDMLEMDKEYNDKVIAQDLDASRKRADIWQAFTEKIADLQQKNQYDVQDQGLGYNRDVSEAYRKYLDDQAKTALTHAQRMEDIETDYQKKIRDIQRDYSYQAEELIRQRDAIGYFALVRKMNADRQTAKDDRQKSVQDANVDNDRKQQEQQKAFEIEKRELSIHNQEKLQDLATALKRELSDAEKSRERGLSDAKKDDKRRTEDLNTAYGIRRRDAKTAADLERSSELKTWTDKKTALAKNLRESLDLYYGYYKTLAAMQTAYNKTTGSGSNSTPPPQVENPWMDVGTRPRSIGASGLVTSGLSNSMYSPPAMPSRNSQTLVGKGRITVDVNVNGQVDAVTTSQLVRTVKEVMSNALA